MGKCKLFVGIINLRNYESDVITADELCAYNLDVVEKGDGKTLAVVSYGLDMEVVHRQVQLVAARVKDNRKVDQNLRLVKGK